MSVHILYSSRTQETGRLIAETLREAGIDISHGSDQIRDGNVDLVRWGSSAGVGHRIRGKIFNNRNAVANATNKYLTLEMLSEAGVPVPKFGRTISEFETIPIIWRGDNHRAGNNFRLIKSISDVRNEPNSISEGYYIEFIKKQREYRVFATPDSTLIVYEKAPIEGQPQTCNYRWNMDFGYEQRQCRAFSKGTNRSMDVAIDAVRVLGLDFGAVDIVEYDNKPYVIEVNTGPTLGEYSLPIVIQYIRSKLNI